MTALLEAALTWHTAGICVVPARPDGTKAPAAFWKRYQTARPDTQQIHAWFTNGTYDGLGAITGHISGNLEMLETEGRAADLAAQLGQMLTDNGFGDLWQRITTGYLETSPSGGYHWLYRVDGPPAPNTKLARRPSTPDELAEHVAALTADAEREPDPDVRGKRLDAAAKITRGEQVPQALIETRGEGGFTVLAPSAGRTHPTGAAWAALLGTPATIPTITVDERDTLYAFASTFDQMPPVEAPERQGTTSSADDGTRPGDDYNTRATWDDILAPRGWTKVKRVGKGYGWTRPGKSPRDGISATTGQNEHDRLYVFSSSTEFETERAYSKFAAYVLLEHGGDYAAAARALAADGYGQRREPGREVASLQALIAPSIQGNLATVTSIPAPAERPMALVTERTLDHSDDSNALLLIDRFGDKVRYIPQRGRWVAWDGVRWHWCPAGGGVVREYAKRIARSLPEDEQPDRTHKKKSLSANGTTAMITQAETDDRITTNLEQLDAHPHELNTPAGIVNLASGRISSSNPARLHTRMTTVAPDREQATPRWDQFLAETFAGSDTVGPFVRRLAGYSATGNVTHHILPFLHGPGGNGKSVFLDVLRALLGDYAGSAPAKFLMAHSQQHETEIARLSGLRMVICSEVNQEDKFDEAKVKLLTGGDALTARFMRQDHFTFTPTHHLWLMGNHQPKVSGGGESFWRRLRLVPFANVVEDDKKIDDLATRLIDEEGPGILAWIIEGAAEVIARGMQAPAEVMAATHTYATEEDVLARFIADRCHLGGAKQVRIPTAELRAAYTKWCAEEGERPLPPQVFGRELRTRYDIEQTRSNGRRYYLSVTLLTDDEGPDRPDEWWEK